MNTKLAEALAGAVVSLSKEDYNFFQERLTDKMIRKTPGVVGGAACIRNTRIAVWILIFLINQGGDDAELLRSYPGLTRFDLLAMRAYYQVNQAEIDAEIVDQHKDNWDNLEQHPSSDATHRPFDLTDSAFVGMWRDRPDMQDSTAWVRQQRQ